MKKYIKIEDDTYTEVIRESDPEEKYDGDDTYTSHNIKGAIIVGENVYHDLAIDFDPVSGQEYYLVSIIYSTGDSFSHSEGNIEFVGLYKTEETATQNVKRLQEFYNVKRGTTVLLLDNNGNEVKMSVPTMSHFEVLSTIDIDGIQVKYGKKSFRLLTNN